MLKHPCPSLANGRATPDYVVPPLVLCLIFIPINSYSFILLRVSVMGRLSIETRQRVVLLWKSGMKIKDIHRRLREENTVTSETSLYLLIAKYAKCGKVSNIKRSSRPSILGNEHYKFIDNAMEEDDELTAYKLHCKLKKHYPDLNLSISTVRRARKVLGWVSTKPRYCQLKRDINKEKRLIWCEQLKANNDKFLDVIWTDECTVELQRHSLRCF